MTQMARRERGKKAPARVARIDDADYDLVMQHRWQVLKFMPRKGRLGRRPMQSPLAP